MRIWEIARKPRLVVRDLSLPLTVVRARTRKAEETIVPVLRDYIEKRVLGYLTPIELIMPTSHHTMIRVRDTLREHPIIVQDKTLGEVFEKLREFKTIGAPVVNNLEEMKLHGIVTYNDILNYLIKASYKPIAESVAEIMTEKDLDKYIVTAKDRVNKVWSRIVYHGQPGVVVVRSEEEPIPQGIVTYHEFMRRGRWFFHRESEQHITTPAKVQRIMLRGVMVATKDMPVEAVAEVMARHDIPLVPVIDENGHVIGVITYEDIIRAYLEGAKPGRAPVPVKVPMPIPVKAEERILYVSREKTLSQVLVEKVVAVERAGIVAEDIMIDELPAITINDTVEHARKEMLRRRTDYLVVLDEDENVIGVVSKWNMLYALGLKGPLWRRRTKDRYFIDYIMTKNVPKIRPDTPLEDIALQMVNSESEVVFVVDENGEIIGFVTKDQVVDVAKETLRDLLVENVILPGKTASVHPFHSLYHTVNKMKALYLDALTVYDGPNVLGVVSANRLPFVAFEDAVTGVKSRRLIWVRKLVRGAARKGRYVKITPLVALDVMVPYSKYIPPNTLLSRAIDMMKEANLNGIPVLSEDRQIVSIVSKNDILRDLARRAKKLAEVKKKVKETEETVEA
ncbi:MAG: CBS domain-containing protein [Staphylothermus sp.]|nr:CBS domain-containing protein [Staphylothermus sp.]